MQHPAGQNVVIVALMMRRVQQPRAPSREGCTSNRRAAVTIVTTISCFPAARGGLASIPSKSTRVLNASSPSSRSVHRSAQWSSSPITSIILHHPDLSLTHRTVSSPVQNRRAANAAESTRDARGSLPAPTCLQVQRDPGLVDVGGVALGPDPPDRSAVHLLLRGRRHVPGGREAGRRPQTGGTEARRGAAAAASRSCTRQERRCWRRRRGGRKMGGFLEEPNGPQTHHLLMRLNATCETR